MRGLPSLIAAIALDDGADPRQTPLPIQRLAELCARDEADGGGGDWPRFPFNHPLFVLFSSGTTGAPKCIVHGAGGTLLEHLKEHRLHVDLRPGDKLFFHTSAAWMMWNWQLSALASGCAIVLYDGPVSGPDDAVAGRLVRARSRCSARAPPISSSARTRGLLAAQRAAAREPARGALDRLDPARLAVRLGSRAGRARCRFSRSPAAPTSSAASCSATRTCPSSAAGSSAAAWGSTCRRWRRRRRSRTRRPASSCAAIRSPRGHSASSVTEARRFHDAYFAQNPGVWTHGDLIEFDADGSGAHARPLGRRAQHPRRPHRPGRDLPRAATTCPR